MTDQARMDGKACRYCEDQPEPGRIETDNNGPIVDCPMCKPPMTTDRKAGHTAGPWAVNPLVAQVDAFVGGKPLPICQLLWPTKERSEAETEANARLIAAAPDLLAACEALVEGMQACGVDGPYLQQAISAIARAKGEA
jgi:hypothetical protein